VIKTDTVVELDTVLDAVAESDDITPEVANSLVNGVGVEITVSTTVAGATAMVTTVEAAK
jgi:hypothetical protein